MRESVIFELRALRSKVRNVSVSANNLRGKLSPSENVGVGEELLTVSDAAMELYYLLSETIDNLEA